MGHIKVILIDDHSLVLESLKSLLSHYEDIEVIGVSTTGRDGIHFIEKNRPDVCVLDVRLPDMSGVEVINRIRKVSDEISVLCLSSFDSKYEISEMISAGASGYLLKHVTAEEFINAIRMVHKGSIVLHPDIARKILEYSRTLKDKETLINKLSSREIEVLRLMWKGMSNKEIANYLYLSEDTIKTHVSRIFQKLNARNRVEAIAEGIKLGIIEVPEEQQK